MRRILVVLVLLLSGALAASGMWMLSPPSITPFIVAGATDVQVVTVGWGQRQISYRSSGPPDAWYWTVTRTLEEQHWTLRNPWRPYESPTYDPIVPLRFEREYAGVLQDEVVLVPDRRDPQRATITVHRRIIIPWWRSWLPTGEGPTVELRHTVIRIAAYRTHYPDCPPYTQCPPQSVAPPQEYYVIWSSYEPPRADQPYGQTAHRLFVVPLPL